MKIIRLKFMPERVRLHYACASFEEMLQPNQITDSNKFFAITSLHCILRILANPLA